MAINPRNISPEITITVVTRFFIASSESVIVYSNNLPLKHAHHDANSLVLCNIYSCGKSQCKRRQLLCFASNLSPLQRLTIKIYVTKHSISCLCGALCLDLLLLNYFNFLTLFKLFKGGDAYLFALFEAGINL